VNRRELMLLLGGAMIAPVALNAQQKAAPVIGFLGVASPGPYAPYVIASQGRGHLRFRSGWKESQEKPMLYNVHALTISPFFLAYLHSWAARLRPWPIVEIYSTFYQQLHSFKSSRLFSKCISQLLSSYC
jgi:hypothetical protein